MIWNILELYQSLPGKPVKVPENTQFSGTLFFTFAFSKRLCKKAEAEGAAASALKNAPLPQGDQRFFMPALACEEQKNRTDWDLRPIMFC